MAIEVGLQAPDFTRVDQRGEPVTLSSFRGRKNVVLMFYPLAFSGVCTRQFCDVGAHEDRYSAANAQTIGISIDSHHVQGAFGQSLDLEHTLLLSDFHPLGEIARRYDVFNDERGHSRRASFVIDTAGIIRYVQITAPGEMPDEEGLLEALAQLQ